MAKTQVALTKDLDLTSAAAVLPEAVDLIPSMAAHSHL